MHAASDDAALHDLKRSGNAENGWQGDFDDHSEESPSLASRPTTGMGVSCQVPGCKRTLDSTYAKKCRCCTDHRSAVQVLLNDIPHRFCQKCSRFQELTLFDGTKRNCRQRLYEHNCRQRRLRMLRRAKVDPDVEAKLEEDAMDLAAFGVAAMAEQGQWGHAPAPAPAPVPVPAMLVARPAAGGFGGPQQPSSSASTLASDGAGAGAEGAAALDLAALAEVTTLLSGLDAAVLTNPQVLAALQQLLAVLPGSGVAAPAPLPPPPPPPPVAAWGGYSQPDPSAALAALFQQMVPQQAQPQMQHQSMDQALLALLGAAAAGGPAPPAGGPGPYFGGQPPKY